MALVKNDIVKMDWTTDEFKEDRNIGFICAIKDYHGVTVVFQNGVAYGIIDDQGSFSPSDIWNQIKKSFKKVRGEITTVYEMDEFDEYTEFIGADKEVSEGNVKYAGLTDDDVVDMLKRLDDLSPYFSYHDVFENM